MDGLFVFPGAIHKHHQEQGQILRRANDLVSLLALAFGKSSSP